MAVSTVKSEPRTEPRSQHTSDAALQPFLQDSFDPAAYLNSTLPSLTTSTRISAPNHASLNDLASQTQTLLSQLSAQTTRLSNALTQLTDEIIRSGARLAYEVDVLKGETTGLTDALDGKLRKDIEIFTPKQANKDEAEAKNVEADGTASTAPAATETEPEYLKRLRTLTLVRSRLDSVIKTFGDAMAWQMAPSDLQSSLISISAPEDTEEARSREAKGKQYAESLRREISTLVGDGKDMAGLEAAAAKVEQLRVLCAVWKGTAEEKARGKFVDGLQKIVEDKAKAAGKSGLTVDGGRRSGVSPARGMDYRYGGAESGYGFLQGLKNLRSGDVYME